MMKFDPSSIYNRAVSKLQQNPDWRAITNNSVISALIKSNSEINAETARYMEYLFKESKYDTAQNPSSIMAMANMLGYQPKRKRSATGTLWVSADPRTHLIGKTISMDTVSSEISSETNSLGWVSNPYKNLNISSSSVIKDSSGNSYVAISSKTLTTGSYYTTLDIIQGIRKSLFIDIDTIRSIFTQSRMYPYVYIPFKITDCEDASTVSSRRFFKVYVVTGNSSSGYSYSEYRVVDNLLLSESSDYDVEVYNDIYSQEVFYLKFNNDPTMGHTLDLSSNTSISGIRIDYLESLGSSSNVDTLYENFTITESTIMGSSNEPESSGVKLYGVNTSFLTGGYDEEDASSIKNNATKFYISNYSVGTRESYENTILNTVFKVEDLGLVEPKKVRVYGGMYLNPDTGIKQPVTYISFISNNLEDLATSSLSSEQYNNIEESLNYYLGRLKSPQDVLKFEPPEYVALAFGINCSVSSETSTEGLNVIETNVMNTVDSQWGPNSDYLDFGNSFSPSYLSKSIMDTYEEVSSVDIEVEAIKRLMWDRATRIRAKTSSSVVTHTCRIPFEFNPVFLGNKTYKGFKDYRVGSNYMFRVDIMYKKPLSLNNNTLNKSIFISEPSEGRSEPKFYIIHDQESIWGDEIYSSSYYTELTEENKISSNNCYQVNLISGVYTDNDFSDFKNRVKEGRESTKNSINDPGALDNYLIYFSGDYNEDSSTIGNGWMEFSFDALYNMIQAFSAYDTELATDLEKCSLNLLKCSTSDTAVFNRFISIIKDYVDIYVSMRPIDSNLKLLTPDMKEDALTNNNKSILYVDSYDSYVTSLKKDNLTYIKKPRMISVKCKYEDN